MGSNISWFIATPQRVIGNIHWEYHEDLLTAKQPLPKVFIE